MRDYLLDLVEHSYDLGCIDLIKVTCTYTETSVDGLAEDKSVVLQAKFAPLLTILVHLVYTSKIKDIA